MDANEAFVLVAAIAAGAVVLAFLIRYGAQVVRNTYGTAPAKAGDDALTQSEVESMIRRAVREEVRPLREKIERIERLEESDRQPPSRFEEDPHDFGLIAEGPGEHEAQDRA